MVETGEPYFAYTKPFEYAEHPERGVTYWDWSLVPIKDPGGAVTGLVFTLANVTERVRAEEALRESEQKFRALAKSTTASITLKVDVDDVSLGVDAAIPCGLIINELVSNALKHAFPAGREGEICINLRADGGELTLIVSDNGVSFPEDLDFRNMESLGLSLITTLASQLGGTIELDRSGGTAFRITFAGLTH